MGVWETDYFDVATCPCGKGRVKRVVESPDNPWSRIHVSYELACADCTKAWDLSALDGSLTERSTLLESREADEASRQAEAAVVEYLNSLLTAWSFPAYKTMAAEFDYLTEKGLYRETIGKYRFARRTSTMGEIAKARPNSSIVPELIQKVGSPTTYSSLAAQAQAARKAAEAKSKAVKRIRLPSQH